MVGDHIKINKTTKMNSLLLLSHYFSSLPFCFSGMWPVLALDLLKRGSSAKACLALLILYFMPELKVHRDKEMRPPGPDTLLVL